MQARGDDFSHRSWHASLASRSRSPPSQWAGRETDQRLNKLCSGRRSGPTRTEPSLPARPFLAEDCPQKRKPSKPPLLRALLSRLPNALFGVCCFFLIKIQTCERKSYMRIFGEVCVYRLRHKERPLHRTAVHGAGRQPATKKRCHSSRPCWPWTAATATGGVRAQYATRPPVHGRAKKRSAGSVHCAIPMSATTAAGATRIWNIMGMINLIRAF